MKPIIVICITLLTTLTMQAQNDPYPSQVHVTGIGIVNIVPDQVTITVRIENTGSDAVAVKRKNDTTVREVLAFLSSTKIADKHIRTDYIRLSKNYEYNTKSYNYVANQAITVHLDDLAMYEQVMNGLLNSGVNRIDDVSFSAANVKDLEVQARKKAMQNAKQKAVEYAGALDQQIGRAVTISENTSYSNPGPTTRKMAFTADAASAPTIAPGELEILVQVSVSFVLQ